MIQICDKDHRDDPMFIVLPISQAHGDGRHKCAGCAYDQGLIDGTQGLEPNFRPDDLNWSQAGVVRHKSALAGYMMGYVDGLRTIV